MRQFVLKSLMIILVSSCSTVKWHSVDSSTGEIVSEKNERVSCNKKESENFMCLKIDDILKLKRSCD
jgi:hypothetical protein